MKQFFVLTIAASALMTNPQIIGLSSKAEAAAPSTHQLKNEGRRQCRAIATGWVANIRGLEYGDYQDLSDRFRIKYCFHTRAQCAQFANNIERIAYPVEVVTYRNCRPY